MTPEKLAPDATVSKMKHALLLLGCPSIRVTAKLESRGVHMTIETFHSTTGAIRVERTFTLSEYLNGPMQPLYFEIYQRVLSAEEALG